MTVAGLDSVIATDLNLGLSLPVLTTCSGCTPKRRDAPQVPGWRPQVVEGIAVPVWREVVKRRKPVRKVDIVNSLYQ